jgi:hypothetical protein
MLGRKTYEQQELDNAKGVIDKQLAAYKKLAKAIDNTSDPKAKAALDSFEPLFFNNLLLALDRYFVHRLRVSTGKDGNPLNEAELMVESLLNNGGKLRGNNVIKLEPDESVLKINYDEKIELSQDQFERLYKAFMAELKTRFVE